MRKTRTIWTGVSTAIVGFATMVGAQTTSAPQSTTPSTEAQITVTGCLKQGVMTVGIGWHRRGGWNGWDRGHRRHDRNGHDRRQQ